MNEESKIIWEALNSNNPQIETQNACRQILRQRIRKADFNDRELRVIVDEIVEKLDFSIDFGMEEEQIKPISRTKKSSLQKLSYGSIGVLGLCSSFIPHPALRIIGFSLALLSGFGFGKMYIQDIANTTSQNTKMIVKSTTEEILQKVNVIYKRLSALFQFNQLEGRYQEVLRWLQYQYSYNTDKNYREKLSELLSLFNYELVKYDSTLSNYFEERKANVSKKTTTLYALKNKKNNLFILNGIVVFPLDNNKKQ